MIVVSIVSLILLASREKDIRSIENESGSGTANHLLLDSDNQRAQVAPEMPSETAGRKRVRAQEAPHLSDVLQVTVCEGANQFVAGSVTWVATPDARGSFDLLERSKSTHAAVIRETKHNGMIDLIVPSGKWIWLCITGDSGKGMPRMAYRRVAPFEGAKQLAIDFGVNGRRLHVFVLDEAMQSRAEHADLKVYKRNLQHGGPASFLRLATTDKFGYVCLDGLDAGLYVVVVGERGLETSFPHCARLVLPDGLPQLELYCTLVTPPPSVSVRFRINMSGLLRTTEAEVRPKLFLKSVGLRHGTVLPIGGTLENGITMRTVALPLGDYEIGVLPQGEVVFAQNSRFINVRSDCEVHLDLAKNHRRTSLVLEGIGKREYPFRVYKRPAGYLWDGRADLLFVGPFSWRGPEWNVPQSEELCSVVALGRRSTWLSKSDVVLKGGRVRVSMRSATLLHLQVSDKTKSHDLLKGVEVTWVGGQKMVALRRKLYPANGIAGALLTGCIVVPKGAVMMRAYAQGSEAVVWSKQIHANRSRMAVSIDL